MKETIKKLFLIVSCTIGLFGALAFYSPPVKYVDRQRIEYRDKPEKSVAELLPDAAQKLGVPAIIAHVLIRKESGGRNYATKFEPGQMERARKAAPKGSEPDIIKMYASSHCAMQIMGWWAPAFGKVWSDFYKPEVCAQVSMEIVAQCQKRWASEQDKYKKNYQVFKCYNGSDAYAEDAMNILTEILVDTYL